jgi:hypothetical protein
MHRTDAVGFRVGGSLGGLLVPAMKTELVAAQLIGVAVLRYVVEVEPIASASVDDVVELAAPSIRATLRA